MEFLFADYTQKTEALVTGIRLQNEAFDIYELQLLGLDKNDSCSYTNSGTATISDTELQELLHTKGLPFPNGIVGQRIKILSNFGDAERTSPGGYFTAIEQQRRRIEYRWMKGTNAMLYLTYNYTNARRSRMAIACVIRCKNTYEKQLRVRDIIEMHRPGLYQRLSRGDKSRVGRAISRLYNQGMLPHLNRGKKKGSTNTSYC